MPYKTTDFPAGFQAFLSDASMDSLVGSFIEEHTVSATFYSGTVVNGTTVTLTCGEFAVLIPQLAQTYGNDAVLDVEGVLLSAGNFVTSQSEQQISAEASAMIRFHVHTADGEVVALELLAE